MFSISDRTIFNALRDEMLAEVGLSAEDTGLGVDPANLLALGRLLGRNPTELASRIACLTGLRFVDHVEEDEIDIASPLLFFGRRRLLLPIVVSAHRRGLIVANPFDEPLLQDVRSECLQPRLMESMELMVATPETILDALGVGSKLIELRAKTSPALEKDHPGNGVGFMPTLTQNPLFESVASDLVDLIPRYLMSRREDVSRLREALAAEDFQSLAYLAHVVQGNGAAFGFDGLRDLGTALERASVSESAEGVECVLDDISGYLDQVQIEFVSPVRHLTVLSS